ncbi:MAG: hypothetical protein DYG98_00400 [Haliscomenobacteraceae bacterium CHB4]|nr:hypothetical protein [Saprospiraceae bacterium]MCE7921496.1 hypothetical protein [Haliscomenobacteraceae bacterium CHB4]
MNQLFTQLALLGGAAFLFFYCTSRPDCYDLPGRWTNREGQVLVFQPDGKALWLIQFGSQFDTFPIRYTYDCSRNPATLDLSGFQAGPLTGKTLFGILEWAGDTVFRFDAEPGASPEVRPKTFNVEQTMRYYRE